MPIRFFHLAILLVAMSAGSGISSGWAADVSPKVTGWKQAMELAAAAYGVKASHEFVKGLGKGNFFDLDLYQNNSSVVIDLAVNKRTGDVWDTFDCRKLHSKRLTILMDKIRLSFTDTEMESYRKLTALKPGCLFQ